MELKEIKTKLILLLALAGSLGAIQACNDKGSGYSSHNNFHYQNDFGSREFNNDRINRSWHPGGDTYTGGSGSSAYFYDSGSACSVVGGQVSC